MGELAGAAPLLLNRREFASLAAIAATSIVLPAMAADAADDIQAAFDFAFPVFAIVRTRQAALARGAKLNQFSHRRSLSGPTDRGVTTPNNDTLYSAAWLDLSAGPLLLTIPSSPRRYHSVALINLFTDNDAVLGTQAGARNAKQVLLCGPTWAGEAPRGTLRVRAASNDAWLIARILADGPTDLDQAGKVQSGYQLSPLNTAAPLRPLATSTGEPVDPAALLDVVNGALARSPLPPNVRRKVKRFRALGIHPGEDDAWDRLAPVVQDRWRSNIRGCYDSLRGGLERSGVRRNGWSYPEAGIGTAQASDHYRACVALGGLGALPTSEAVYLSSRLDSLGRPFDGDARYRLRIPKDVPAEAFWSLSMYEIVDDGRLFFTPNEKERYALGDRTPDVMRRADGSISVAMQRLAPSEADANWLPTPPGPFALTFRAYLPKAALLTGKFALPAVERIP